MKGISRTAVVVKPSGGEVFEEAIFIVREDYLRSRENGREELLREAERAAEAYAASPAPDGAVLERMDPGPALALARHLARHGGVLAHLALGGRGRDRGTGYGGDHDGRVGPVEVQRFEG